MVKSGCKEKKKKNTEEEQQNLGPRNLGKLLCNLIAKIIMIPGYLVSNLNYLILTLILG